ncbi:MAG: TonB-dependent receptor [Gammaproteobacteria bacterium]|nr:TonB-dependent receptor [Gammaproteobacteria bacterium]MDH5302905.1 TonB-dependent receptor [Gammaproteobacteria bacterium]MDH5321010.1 TonB-dependent receptor [Gammaproteobacteria bacterium]
MNTLRSDRKSMTGLWAPTAMVVALLAAGPVLAQDQQGDDGMEEIVVTETGTSLRGAPPVGQNLISVGELAIQESGAVSVQQIMNDVPQITGFGNAAQGAYGSADGSGTFAPTIHSLGASASNSTLILVNGHRIPLSGTRHTLADPSIIPPAALRRVDVLPDGASAVYGSDAVAGVLNFVTKRNVEDTEVSAQVGFGDGYDTQNLNFVTGSAWAGGNVTLAYAYSYRSELASKDRPKITSDLRDRGGRNFSSFNCGPTTMQVGGVRYDAPYGAGDTFTDAYCNTDEFTSLIGSEKRHSVFLSYQKEYSDDLLLDVEFVYSDRRNLDDISAGTLSTTATNANPYFVSPGTTGATSGTVNWDANEMLGAAKGIGTQQVFYVAPKLEYDFGNSWAGSLGAMVGRDSATEIDENELCSFCARDLLDDTDPATALNIWTSGANVSASELLYLQDSMDEQRAVQTMSDVILKFDGEVFSLPGGPAKLAVGANTISYNINQVRRRPAVTGPASTNTQVIDTDIDRDVTAFFGEMYLPVTERFDLNLAIRADDYSDFGSTTNPRFAAQYQLTDSLKIRATYAESFVAPALTSRGEEPTGQTTESGWGQAPTQRSFIPSDFSDDSTAAYIAWAQANFPASCTADGCYINDGQIRGANVTGGNYGLNAGSGETWSVGFDLVNPDWLPGLRLSITYYDKLLEQMVTAPRLDVITVVPGLNDRLVLMPTQAELDAWTFGLQQNSDLPTMPGLPAGTPVPFLWSFQQVNAFNIDSAGFDVAIDYSWDTDIGDFIVAYSFNKKTRFDQQAGTGGIWQDFLNGDLNTTFSSLEFLSNASVSWNRENVSAKLTWKYTNAYDVRNDPLQSEVDAYNIFNLYVSYDIDAWGTQLFLQGSNITDEDPPFFNTNGGYNSSESSPIGRVLTLGLRKTF